MFSSLIGIYYLKQYSPRMLLKAPAISYEIYDSKTGEMTIIDNSMDLDAINKSLMEIKIKPGRRIWGAHPRYLLIGLDSSGVSVCSFEFDDIKFEKDGHLLIPIQGKYPYEILKPYIE